MKARALFTWSKTASARHGAALLAALFGLFQLVRASGIRTLDPCWAGWLTAGDGLAHLMGWLFYRIEPWRLPLGTTRGLLYPFGTTVGLSDSLPWIAVICKVFSPVLPNAFQYFGLWLGACYALQGYVAAKIVKIFHPSPLLQFLGGALFTISAPLTHRVEHEALCAHWALLLAIWMHLRPCASARGAHRAVWAMFALNMFFAGIHPYLEMMLLTLGLALYARLWLAKLLRAPLALGASAITVTGVFACFYLFGYLGGEAPPLGADGFGEFSSDLATLVNPGGYSNLFEALPRGHRQYEGMAYLGAGVLALLLFGTGALLSWRPLRIHWKHAPLVVACLALAVFALANPITWLGQPVLRVDWLYRSHITLASSFRSSGRFVWPLYYLVITFAVAATVLGFRRRTQLGAVVLALALSVQAYDIRIDSARAHLARDVGPNISSPWALLSGVYKHLAHVPPMIAQIANVPFSEPRVAQLAYIAYNAQLTVNSGYTSRMSTAQIVNAREWATTLTAAKLDADTVYVTEPDGRGLMERLGARCGALDGMVACVRPDRVTEFSRYLERHP